jgi:hypothetical protein
MVLESNIRDENEITKRFFSTTILFWNSRIRLRSVKIKFETIITIIRSHLMSKLLSLIIVILYKLGTPKFSFRCGKKEFIYSLGISKARIFQNPNRSKNHR